jgi:hypothetical protein
MMSICDIYIPYMIWNISLVEFSCSLMFFECKHHFFYVVTDTTSSIFYRNVFRYLYFKLTSIKTQIGKNKQYLKQSLWRMVELFVLTWNGKQGCTSSIHALITIFFRFKVHSMLKSNSPTSVVWFFFPTEE